MVLLQNWEVKFDWYSQVKNLWLIVDGDTTKPIKVKQLVVLEEKFEQARGIIGHIVSENLYVHIKFEDILFEVWKTLASMYDNNVNILVNYL